VSTNLTIESPNFSKIQKEAGSFTADAISLLWAALNDTRAVERRDFRRASDKLAPKAISLAPSASVNDLDTEGASVISFTGANSVNLTGFRAPETAENRLLFIQVNGAGTITVKNSVTSETGNQIVTSTGADVSLTTGKGLILAYLAAKWRQVV
jgi:hypothetical protein